MFDSPIAQSVERRTVNPQVPGSSPGRGAKIMLFLSHSYLSYLNFSGNKNERGC